MQCYRELLCLERFPGHCAWLFLGTRVYEMWPPLPVYNMAQAVQGRDGLLHECFTCETDSN